MDLREKERREKERERVKFVDFTVARVADCLLLHVVSSFFFYRFTHRKYPHTR